MAANIENSPVFIVFKDTYREFHVYPGIWQPCALAGMAFATVRSPKKN